MFTPPCCILESAAHVATVAALVLAVACGWLATLLGMPGNWLVVGSAALYAWQGPQQGSLQITWQTVLALSVLAFGGEVAEAVTSMVGARRAGGSRRAAVFSLIASMAGAIIGATLGLPIPIFGSAVGAVLGGAIGAFAGAAFAEYTRGELARQSLRVGHAAFWGRVLGTVAKTTVASIIGVAVIIALCV